MKRLLHPLLIALCAGSLFTPALADTTLDGHAEIGLGYDSNPYRTPDSSYIDYSIAAAPLINPDKKSGLFIPLDIGVDYTAAMTKRSDFFASYDFDGRAYFGGDLQNANRYHQSLKAGARYKFSKSKKRKHRLSFALIASDHYQIYVDKDNGEYKNTQYDGTGTDIPDRYQYRSFGAELAYERETKRYDYGAELVYKIVDYPKPDAWSELDYTYYKVAVDGEIRFAKYFAVDAKLSHYVKDYDVRPSYEYNATDISLLSSNPAVKYRYESGKVGFEYKQKRLFKAKLAYTYTQRTDEHQGYNDYTYNKLGLSGTYTFSPDWHFDAGAEQYWQRYPNALAFDEIGQEAKYFDGQEFDTKLRYRYNKQYYFAAEIVYNNQTSSDKRYEYNRLQSMLTAKMKF